MSRVFYLANIVTFLPCNGLNLCFFVKIVYFYKLLIQKTNIMSVLKVIEVMADSSKSWEDATRIAIKHAAKSVKHIKSAYVQSQSVVVKDGDVSDFRVNVKITFEVK